MNDAGRTVLLVILALILLPLLWGTVMMGAMGPGMMGGWGGWGSWDGWSPWRALLTMLSTVLVLGGLGAIVWWVFAKAGGLDAQSGGAGDDARAALDARYARGELTREQYHQIRRDLES